MVLKYKYLLRVSFIFQSVFEVLKFYVLLLP